ncbi:MAG: hypothetical protein EXS08_14775 [Planctomycetes bacterium]|nr:hypothetical protein [Planctomycetota bacterium]
MGSTRHSLASLRRGSASVGLLTLLCASCQSGPWQPREPWSFALTRTIWSDPPEFPLEGGRDDEYAVLAIVCLPLALDLAFLPVTLTHDLRLD